MQNTQSLQQFILHQTAIIARLRQLKFEEKKTKTTYSNAYKILTVGGLFYIAIYRTFVFQHAYIRMCIFYARKRIQYGHGMRIFRAFIKQCLRCDVTELLMWVRFSPKSKLFIFTQTQ